ncbi:mCG1033814 [Mus musculus]|nr:mCG1033814 [Mus musculus]
MVSALRLAPLPGCTQHTLPSASYQTIIPSKSQVGQILDQNILTQFSAPCRFSNKLWLSVPRQGCLLLALSLRLLSLRQRDDHAAPGVRASVKAQGSVQVSASTGPGASVSLRIPALMLVAKRRDVCWLRTRHSTSSVPVHRYSTKGMGFTSHEKPVCTTGNTQRYPTEKRLPGVRVSHLRKGEFEMSVDEPTGTESFSGRTSSGSWSSCSIQDTWNDSGGEPKDQLDPVLWVGSNNSFLMGLQLYSSKKKEKWGPKSTRERVHQQTLQPGNQRIILEDRVVMQALFHTARSAYVISFMTEMGCSSECMSETKREPPLWELVMILWGSFTSLQKASADRKAVVRTVFEMPGNEPTGTESFSGRTSSDSWSSCSIQDTWNDSGGSTSSDSMPAHIEEELPPPSPQPSNPEDRELYSQYNVVRTIGHGTHAKVLLAQHRLTGTPVAIKVLAKNKPWFQPAMEETNIMKKIKHPNIVSLLQVGEAEDNHIGDQYVCLVIQTAHDYLAQ